MIGFNVQVLSAADDKFAVAGVPSEKTEEIDP